ncbi:DEAD/DEAH box helicase [Pyrodictium abyssi]|uniref:DEAD/DEAH box helicase n=1 Tax=Pyrodictium abyssi TaxID=54256 RepID=A0ABN6ZN19_9CREN|nr:hypothetical protein PABY_11760 [Pyrodictium abyssi]
MARLKPRDYQREAAEWALREGAAVVCMPTGTGKTLVAVLWIEELLRSGRARRVLVLEPTRFLVEQSARFLQSQGLDAAPVHGSLSRGERSRGWRSRVVVATPEIVVAEWREFLSQGFDAVVVDECHHTTGQDAYMKVMKGYRFRWRLGLTAYVPPSRRREIEELIGRIRCWGWDDPRLSRYLPGWEAEVYEAPLNDAEARLYMLLEEAWDQATGGSRSLLGNAIRWLVRDGALALMESLERSQKLRSLVPREALSLLYSGGVRPAHKLGALERVLRDHEGFDKAIVFIDRVVVAEYVAEKLAGYNPVLVLGRRRIDPREALDRARRPGTRLIVSTSAGEEGIDLPEASLLVVWSHTASPLRFIQRLGRVLRATDSARQRPRWVVFIATPDTVDVDSLVDGLLEARRAGVYVNIDPGVVEYIWSFSRRRRVLEAVEEQPAPLDVVARALGMPLPRAREALEWLQARGLAVYIYTHLGRVYAARTALQKLYTLYREALEPDRELEARITVYGENGQRLAGLRGVRDAVEARLARLLKRSGAFTRIVFTVQVPVGRGLVRLARLAYSYRVDTVDVLRLVLDNAYSCPRYIEYMGGAGLRGAEE